MDPQARRTRALLYVSDASAESVYVYSYPAPQLLGTLTGFNNPQGLCTDNLGNIYIDNFQGADVVEYAHGGSSPVKTLPDPAGYPVGCAIDAKNGDLAVSNIYAYNGSAPGSVSIYKHANGTPKTYADPNDYQEFFITYDDAGAILVDGEGYPGPPPFFVLSKLKDGKFTELNVAGKNIPFPGGLLYAGGALTIGNEVGNNRNSLIYEASVNGSIVTVEHTTQLRGTGDCVEYSIRNREVVCPNIAGHNVALYRYPRGGRATGSIDGLEEPIGSAISIAPQN